MPSQHHTTSNHKAATKFNAWGKEPNSFAGGVFPNESVEDASPVRDSETIVNTIMKQEFNTCTADTVEKHWLLDSNAFLMVVYGSILLNSVQMGLAVDYPDLEAVWTGFEHSFTAIFMSEMIIKLYFLHLGYFSEGWNRMDFLLVWMSMLDIWILAPLSDSGGSALGQLSVLRVLRVLRVARMARLLKVFKELFIIMKGMFDALKTIFWVCLLLVLAMYVCSILCVEVMGRETAPYDGYDDNIDAVETAAGAETWNNYVFFGTIPRSMYTMFNIAMGEELATVMRPVAERQFFMLFFFMFFIIFMSFGVLNVIIGVIVDSTAAAAKEMEQQDVENKTKAKLAKMSRITNLVFALDLDNSGSVCLDEIKAGWQDPQFRELIQQIELPHGWTPAEMLSLLDSDADGKLTFEEFVLEFYRAITNDSFQQNCCMHAQLNELTKHVKHLDNKLAQEVKGIKDQISSEISSSLKRIEVQLQEKAGRLA